MAGVEAPLETALRLTMPDRGSHASDSVLTQCVLRQGGAEAVHALACASRLCAKHTVITRMQRVRFPPTRATLTVPASVASTSRHAELMLHESDPGALVHLHSLRTLVVRQPPKHPIDRAALSHTLACLAHAATRTAPELMLVGEVSNAFHEQELLVSLLAHHCCRMTVSSIWLHQLTGAFQPSAFLLCNDAAERTQQKRYSLPLKSARLGVPADASTVLHDCVHTEMLERLCLENCTLLAKDAPTMHCLKHLSSLSMLHSNVHSESVVLALQEALAPQLHELHLYQSVQLPSNGPSLLGDTAWPKLHSLTVYSNHGPVNGTREHFPALRSLCIGCTGGSDIELDNTRALFASLSKLLPKLESITLDGIDMSILADEILAGESQKLHTLSLANVRRPTRGKQIPVASEIPRVLRRLDLTFRVITGNATCEILRASSKWAGLQELRVYGYKAERGSLPALEQALEGIHFPRLERICIGPASDLVRGVAARIAHNLGTDVIVRVTDTPFY